MKPYELVWVVCFAVVPFILLYGMQILLVGWLEEMGPTAALVPLGIGFLHLGRIGLNIYLAVSTNHAQNERLYIANHDRFGWSLFRLVRHCE